MAVRKFKMNQKTDAGYDTLYPETSSDMVIDQSSGKKVSEHIADNVRHVTAAERTAWNAKETTDGARKKTEQTVFRVYKSNKDANGLYTTIDYRRKTDDTLAIRSVLSGGSSPNYTTATVTYYGTNGTSVEKTDTFSLQYDTNGNFTKGQ